jgi:hypothetical protein
MANLTTASKELFARSPDECFESLDALARHCQDQQQKSTDLWCPPRDVAAIGNGGPLQLEVANEGGFHMNDWSFTQLCRLSRVNKDTVNRLCPQTASRVFHETLPKGTRPIQLLTNHEILRSIHGVAYSRLWNVDLLSTLRDAAPDFEPPPRGVNGGTGLYCGEQDLFCFMIDPAGWIEIQGEPFAPGMFAWNSEVGKRSVGVQTFWFQQVCSNHIVWDACEIVDFSRKHTGAVSESLDEIRRIIGDLVAKRDARKDAFAKVAAKAMEEKVAASGDEAAAFLLKHGIARSMVQKAVERTASAGSIFSLWSLVDTLTQLTGEIRYAGDRTEADQKVSKLLSLAV